jgi:Zn-dependent protease
MGFRNRGWYRDDDGRSGGAGGFFGPESPVERSFPFGRLFGVSIELHLVFLIWLAVELLIHLNGGVWVAVQWLTVLCVSILLHEFGHVFGCRWVGGFSNRIVMLPFGGVAYTQPPRSPGAHLITAAAGPAVNLALAVPAGVAAAALHPDTFEVVFFPAPLLPVAAVFEVTDVWDRLLGFTIFINSVLLLLNLIPMLPLDGGRILAALLWYRKGHGPATYAAATVGVFAAVTLGLLGLVSQRFLLVGIAVLGYMECMRMRAAYAGDPGYDAALAWRGAPAPASKPAPAEPAKPWFWQRWTAEREAREDAMVDTILEKIHREGLNSLTEYEKRVLKNATERQKRKG